MASIIERSGRHELRWRDRTGRQRSLSLGPHSDIVEAADAFIAAVLDAELWDVRAAYRRLERFEAGLRQFLEDVG